MTIPYDPDVHGSAEDYIREHKPEGNDDAPPEYSRAECIEQIRGYFRGGRIYPIDLAVSAVHWLTEVGADMAAGTQPAELTETICELKGWLENEEAELPDHLLEETLHWLRVTTPKGAP